jgi:UDP-N-acetylmuramoyl-tripeptide--D-alanyl-D-alanine ligase
MLRSKKIAEITSGACSTDFNIETFSIDSRTVKANEIFIALRGKNNNGHNFIEKLNKSQAILVDELFAKEFPNIIQEFTNTIIVNDCYQALIDIAKFQRHTFTGEIIGITGSVGKTTLKSMLVFLLEKMNIPTTYSLGNLNNHYGLPLSLANMNDNAFIGIFEMGMSGFHEIEFLSKILTPTVGVITEIAPAHQEFFASLEEIAQAKSEICSGISSNNTIFLNYNSPYQEILTFQANEHNLKVNYVSLEHKVDSFVEHQEIYFNNINDYGTKVIANVDGQSITFNIKSIAIHNVTLSLFALAIISHSCKKLNHSINIQEVAEYFNDFNLPQGRGLITQVFLNKKEVLLIDDAYNASPKSMQGGINSLQNINKNKILILGDMLELGKHSIEEHLNLASSIIACKPKLMIVLGENMELLANSLKEKNMCDFKIITCYNVQEIYDNILQHVNSEDLIFLKGSYGSNIHRVASLIYDNTITEA